MKILVLGASGLLGHALFRYLQKNQKYQCYGSIRTNLVRDYFPPSIRDNLINVADLTDFDSIEKLIADLKPNAIVNCLCAAKTDMNSLDKLIPILSMVPQYLKYLSIKYSVRLIHISTNAVFDGASGNYKESDLPNSTSPYGITKILGEVSGVNIATIRSSFIGHNLTLSRGSDLLSWLLSNKDKNCTGYTRCFFNGLTNIELAKIIEKYFLGSCLSGVYHVAGHSISKYSLLELISSHYSLNVNIHQDCSVVSDLTLDASLFFGKTGYKPLSWSSLIEELHCDYSLFNT